eukprot:TRINITY_DN31890_c0_g1_i1.p1 TRINITY_DN31890_c0_g1~~TRINITY_DN31890_c0_g1_i1.p1  ORF type:complete len:609 (-),score=142.25 TRINITY_DN31890_c0_g1_i1:414-2240(-)
MSWQESTVAELMRTQVWAHTELDVWDDDHLSPKQRLEASLQSLAAARKASDARAAAAAGIAIAEARLLAQGPGAEFRAAAAEAQAQLAVWAGKSPDAALASGTVSSSTAQMATPQEYTKSKRKLLHLEARAALARNRPSEALQAAGEMLQLAESDARLKAAARQVEAAAHRRAEGTSAAIQAAEEAVSCAREAGDTGLEAVSLLCLAEAFLAAAKTQIVPPRQASVPAIAAMEGAPEDNEQAKKAERAAKSALELCKNVDKAASRARAAALDILVRTLVVRGQFAEAVRVAEEEVKALKELRLRRAEAGALASFVEAHVENQDPTGSLPSVLDALGRLQGFGGVGAASQVRVALTAALLFTQIGTDPASENPGRILDSAAKYAQQALQVARKQGHFAAEIDVLGFLSSLHKTMALDPPRSTVRQSVFEVLLRGATESVERRSLVPLSVAVRELEESGMEVYPLLVENDLSLALAPLFGPSETWFSASDLPKALKPIVPATEHKAAASKHESAAGPMVMRETNKMPMYSRVRVGGIQYGPRFRQIEAFRPPEEVVTKSALSQYTDQNRRPALVSLLRPSSEADEWEVKELEWSPCYVDAALHSTFAFGG